MANILPPVEFATITGRFMVAGNDSVDPGAEADIVPAKGKGSITPSVGYVLVSGSTPPATVKLATVDFEIDSEGYISDAKTKERNVEVIAPSEAVNPSAFTYRINFDGGLFPGFDFYVVPGSTIDLTDVGRVATSVGVATTRGEPGVGVASMTLSPDQTSLVVAYDNGTEQAVEIPALGEIAQQAQATTDEVIAAALADPDSATRAAGNATYGPLLPSPTGADLASINSTIAAVEGAPVKAAPGGDYAINGHIVLRSATPLDLNGATVTLTEGSETSMVRNERYNTPAGGTRDHDIELRGGELDRGANSGSGNTLHSILIGSADRVTLRDFIYRSVHGEPGTTISKYGVLVQDVTDALIQNIRFPVKVSSDGVHIIGPAERITVRDIVGTCGDDIVSITALDYAHYMPSNWPTGGDVSDVLIENIQMLPGQKGSVKVLAGGDNRVDRVTIRDVIGHNLSHGVNIYQDFLIPGNGAIGDVLVENVSVAVNPGFYNVMCNATVDGTLTLRNITAPTVESRPINIAGESGIEQNRIVIDGVSHRYAAGNSSILINGGTRVREMIVKNAERIGTSAAGNLVVVDGSAVVDRLVIDCAHTVKGESVVYIGGTARVGHLVLRNVRADDPTILVRHNGTTPLRVTVEGGSSSGKPLVRLSGREGCSLDLTVDPTAQMAPAYIRNGTQPVRVNGGTHADVATLTGPREGATIVNTNPAALTVGPVRFAGGQWRSNVDTTTYTPAAMVLASDTFTRSGELVGSAPDVAPPETVWTGAVGRFATDGSALVPVSADSQPVWLDVPHAGAVELSGTIRAATNNSTSRVTRIYMAATDAVTAARLQFSLTVAATVALGEVVSNVYAGATLPNGTIPSNAPAADYPFKLRLSGDQLTATVNGQSATHTLSAAAVAALYGRGRIGILTSDTSIQFSDLTLTTA